MSQGRDSSEEPKCEECKCNTPYTLENDMKNMVSCNAVSKVTMLSMGSLELLLRASVFTVLDLNEMGSTTLPREVLCSNASNFGIQG